MITDIIEETIDGMTVANNGIAIVLKRFELLNDHRKLCQVFNIKRILFPPHIRLKVHLDAPVFPEVAH